MRIIADISEEFSFSIFMLEQSTASNMATIRHVITRLPNHKIHIPKESNIEIQFWFMPIMLIYSTKTEIQQIKHTTLLNEDSVFLDKQLRHWVIGAWHFEGCVFAGSLQPGGRRWCAASKRQQQSTQWRNVVFQKNGVFQS